MHPGICGKLAFIPRKRQETADFCSLAIDAGGSGDLQSLGLEDVLVAFLGVDLNTPFFFEDCEGGRRE
jgi:hypothetical protein